MTTRGGRELLLRPNMTPDLLLLTGDPSPPLPALPRELSRGRLPGGDLAREHGPLLLGELRPLLLGESNTLLLGDLGNDLLLGELEPLLLGDSGKFRLVGDLGNARLLGDLGSGLVVALPSLCLGSSSSGAIWV